ncbi:MAG: undecaprenyldiphospho-muramoylpentapeptide beta-N-acetylglucosaminyltransferase [Bacteroidales bacterium]
MENMGRRFIISGGGTGGHIFPALSIADAIKQREPNAEILFIGANGRMEMDRVPAAGYKIVGLDVSGFDRSNIIKNIAVLYRLGKALLKARRIIQNFKPDAVIGVGGYVSGPTLKVAQSLSIPTIIQEQNSYAGVTNKLLAKSASLICVAYENMDRFFPKNNIRLFGNPIREELLSDELSKEQAYKLFNLDPNKRTLLVIGGSLGAKSINEGISILAKMITEDNTIQVLWQSGKRYFEELSTSIPKELYQNIHLHPFIERMDLAYKVADLVVSRAGASSISELAVLGKAAILIPSPNVAEDHQTKNAMAMVEKGAAVMLKDSECRTKLSTTILTTIKDQTILDSLADKIGSLAQRDSAKRIVEEIYKVIL